GRVSLASMAIFGVGWLLASSAGSRCMLGGMRFFAGVGIGGAMPGTVALVGDYTPQRWRATVIMATFTGAPIGGFRCGRAAGLLLPSFGWPGIFIVGGIVPLLILVALVFWLPESPRFLAAKATLTHRQTALLHRLDVRPGQSAATLDLANANPIAMLFGKGYALQTVLLWIVFFCWLMNLFLFAYSLPQALHLTGPTPV